MTRSFFFSVSCLSIAACGLAPGQTADPSTSGYSWGAAGTSTGSSSDDTEEGDVDTGADADTGMEMGGDTGDSAVVDSGCVATTWYADEDSDGYGNPAVSKSACDQPQGYVAGNGDLNDGDEETGDITRICATESNGEWFSVAVVDLSAGDYSHWFAGDGTIPSPLFVVDSGAGPWCAEYPEAEGSDTLKISGLGTTAEGYGDFLVYSCSGKTGDAVNYDGDTTCAVVAFTVNGYEVGWATDSYDYQYN